MPNGGRAASTVNPSPRRAPGSSDIARWGKPTSSDSTLFWKSCRHGKRGDCRRGESNAYDDGQSAGDAAERSRGQGHPIVQGRTAARIQGVYGTGPGPALAAWPARMVDAH